MAICIKCGKKYFQKECPTCKNENKITLEDKVKEIKNKHNKKKVYIKKTQKNINYSNNLKNKKHANFLIRLLAALIDTIIISIPIALIFNQYFGDAIAAIIIISFWIFWKGQTPGKKILNLKIVNEHYYDINFKTAIIRYIGYFISTLTFFIGFALIAFREDRKGLHDILAKTYVIHTDKEKTNFESDTADKIFAIMSIFTGTFLLIFVTISYQEIKMINEIVYGTNDEKIIEQKQKQQIKQNKVMIDEMNKAKKQMIETIKKINNTKF